MNQNILMPITTFMTRYYRNFKQGGTFKKAGTIYIKIYHLTFFGLVAFFLTSCLEDPTQIGNALLPGSDYVAISSTDTLSAKSYTMFTDSVRTESPGTAYLGTLFDPNFGTTTAGFVSQLRLGSAWDDEPFVIDSVKLFLHLITASGSVSTPHKLRFSEISDEIYNDQAYYSNTSVNLTGYALTDVILPQLKADTTNDIELTLPGNGIDFGKYITRDTSQFFYATSEPDFRSYFKGFYFQMEPGGDPLLLSLSISANPSGYYANYFVIYMHDDMGYSKEYYLILDASNQNASFNKFSYDYSTATGSLRIQHINDGHIDSLSYIQAMNGVFTRLYFPGLSTLKNNPELRNIAINKARLIIPGYFDNIDYYASSAPSPLFIRYMTVQGNRYLVPDYSLDTYHTYYGGKIDTVDNNYKFNLAAFFQKYFNDDADTIKPELDVFLSGGIKNVILKANSSASPVKLEFTYTKF
jgi:hypothetical protein